MTFFRRLIMSIDFEKLKIIVAGICSVILTAGIARFAFTPMLHEMQFGIGLSSAQGGWLATFNYLGYMTGVMLLSFSSNLKFKFYMYRIGLLAAVITTMAMGWTRDTVLWCVLRFISGMSSTAGIILAAGFLLNWLRNRNYRAELGVHYVGIGLGIVLSGVTVIVMSEALSWDAEWEVFGVIGTIFFIPAWLWMPEPEVAQMSSLTINKTGPSSKWMWLMMLSYFCAGFGYVISATFIVAILNDLPSLVGKASWIWTLLGIAATPSAFIWDRVSRRAGDLTALVIAFYMQLVSILLSALFDNTLVNLVAAVLFGNTFIGIVSLTLSLIGRQFPQNPAKAMARLTLSYGLAQVAGPALAAIVSIESGGYREALWLAGVMIFIGIFLLHILMKVDKEDACQKLS
jgi:predicted MFS family arabinose efflux permease